MDTGRLAATEDRHLRTLFGLGAAGTLSDRELLGRFADRGNEAAELAFAALVERHGPMVLRVARAILRDEHRAQDATQATFLLLARKARGLWVRDSLGPWLHAVAFRVAAGCRSAEIRRRRHERRAAGSELIPVPDPDRDEVGRAIHEEIGRLPEPFRLAVVSCHLEGLTQHEAARQLGWPVGTLQSRLDRGRRRLRDRLDRRGFSPSLGVLFRGLPPTKIPDALIAATARNAMTLVSGGPVAGVIGPSVLALIDATTKGILMTKLKISAAALCVAAGLCASGIGLQAARPASATDDPPRLTGPTATPEPEPPRQPERSQTPSAIEAEPNSVPAADSSPLLLDFHATWSAPCLRMRPEIKKLDSARYRVKSIDIDASKDDARGYRITTVPAVVLLDASGNELARLVGEMSATELAAFYDAHRPRPIAPSRDQPSAAEPGLSHGENPKPWATVARIKVKLNDKEWAFGSGTVIWSRPEESRILTSASLFRIKNGTEPAAKDFPVPVTVDLFDEKPSSRQPALLKPVQMDVNAEVMAYDFGRDLAMIRIRPGRQLPGSPVVPLGWEPTRGMKMSALGCSHGKDATAWTTTLLDPNVNLAIRGRSDEPAFAPIVALRCEKQPEEGRGGGGLFTSDGHLAGVCRNGDPSTHSGIYIGPRAIHEFLEWLNPIEVPGGESSAIARMEPPKSPVAAPSEPEPAAEPGLSLPVTPRPWETVVRIRISSADGKASGLASGVVVDSGKNGAVILTSAHGFAREKFQSSGKLEQYQGEIRVDLFDGQLSGRSPARVRCSDRNLEGELIASDFDTDLALVQIRPGRILPTARVVDESWSPQAGMPMIALGCPIGEDATAWSTTIL